MKNLSRQPPNHTKNNQNKQTRLQLYNLNQTDRKLLYLLNQGYYLTQIANQLNLTISGVYRSAQKLEKLQIIERTGNTKPVQYKILLDNIPHTNGFAPGVQATAENPLLEIHGALIKFSNLNQLHSQLEDGRDKLPGLKFFYRVDDSPYNRTDYLFRFGEYEIRVTTKSGLVKKLPDNRYRAPIDLTNTIESNEGLVFPFEEEEERVLERTKNMFVSFLKRLRLESNGQLKIGALNNIGFEGWTQKREYAFNYGEDKVRLSKTRNGVRLALKDLPDGWLDHSPLPGMKAEVEGLRTLAQDLGLVRALRSQGIVTEQLLDLKLRELVEELQFDFISQRDKGEEILEFKETQKNLAKVLKDLNDAMSELTQLNDRSCDEGVEEVCVDEDLDFNGMYY
ncbi:winged helix-turn-helix domain-containing protein [Methanonatronarchaeum sp. AMET-Sl]|uniref:winged helix-turn-helix domain-containing protein n=1 Tax=Methanonatronarchaeum sp. AMET-Sl TaxID=3037654 RepID=UPI00244E1419|nr:winged helix-turn-helix domain-containing protein [Methanonatronarchaeum sp. AMET-Sl]WGI17166.1 winged helix-turn-helix domain-containing protein [Methanonatronarchaeum sp. AMET-Sl]